MEGGGRVGDIEASRHNGRSCQQQRSKDDFSGRTHTPREASFLGWFVNAGGLSTRDHLSRKMSAGCSPRRRSFAWLWRGAGVLRGVLSGHGAGVWRADRWCADRAAGRCMSGTWRRLSGSGDWWGTREWWWRR